MILLSTNWNRPLLALAMICFTVIVCVLLVNAHRWFK